VGSTDYGGMATTPVIEQDWPFVRSYLPEDLEATAKESGALQRKRGVTSAEALLRLAFAWAYVGLSLETTATWAATAKVAQLSDVALLKRLRNASHWFGQLLAQQLTHQADLRRDGLPTALSMCLVDATTVSRPGSTGTDYRVHLKFDLGSLTISDVTVTDAHGGESLKRYPFAAGEIVTGDRGYAHRAGIAAVAATGAFVLVRLNWQNLPLQRCDGSAFDLLGALRSLEPGEVGEWEVQTAPTRDGTPAVPGRLIAVRKSPEVAEAARRKLRAAARKKGKTPDARTLETAGYLFVFTSAPAALLGAGAVLELYRFRWQIELAFKRLKGVLELDEMAAKEPRLCRTFLCIKLLGALLVEQMSHRWVDFSPWGYGRPATGIAHAGVSDGGGDGETGGGRGPDAHPMGEARRGPEPGASRPSPTAPEPSRRRRLLCSSTTEP
jgi:Transposase DDE domain